MENPRLVFSSHKTAPYHFWMDPNLLVDKYFYCSDAFAEAAQGADFAGLTLTRQVEG